MVNLDEHVLFYAAIETTGASHTEANKDANFVSWKYLAFI